MTVTLAWVVGPEDKKQSQRVFHIKNADVINNWLNSSKLSHGCTYKDVIRGEFLAV